jgi:uncharacterized integral membrane protein
VTVEAIHDDSAAPMIRKIVNWVVLLVVTAVVVTFAVANRQRIPVNLDPLGVTNPPLTASPRAWTVALGMVIVGVIIGGVAVWLRQARWRRSARVLDREVRVLRGENQELRHRLEAADATAAPVSTRRVALRPPAA